MPGPTASRELGNFRPYCLPYTVRALAERLWRPALITTSSMRRAWARSGCANRRAEQPTFRTKVLNIGRFVTSLVIERVGHYRFRRAVLFICW